MSSDRSYIYNIFYHFQADFDIDSAWFKLESDESIIKGASTAGDIILFATNATLKILAEARAISIDGTFKMAPKIWKQLFILCVEIPGGVWIPVAFGFLPNKTEKAYLEWFKLLEAALKERNLELSAIFCMGDFEIGIRSSFNQVWSHIIYKGCHFHMAKALWKKVVDAGLKTTYSQTGNEVFVAFIVATIGMAYVPLDRIHEGFKILIKMAKMLPEGRQKEFGKSFLTYFRDTWIHGPFDPEMWNYHGHRGITTNNFNEGYNNKINNHSNLNIHPNPYELAEVIKKELFTACNDYEAACAGNPNLKGSKAKSKACSAKKKALMNDLHNGMVLEKYMKSFGYMCMANDQRGVLLAVQDVSLGEGQDVQNTIDELNDILETTIASFSEWDSSPIKPPTGKALQKERIENNFSLTFSGEKGFWSDLDLLKRCCYSLKSFGIF